MDQSAVLEQPARMISLFGQLVDKSEALTGEYLKATRRTLEALVSDPHILRGFELTSVPRSYARNLLMGHGDMSVWAMTWAPGSKTLIHDHHCSCCFGVLRGALTEIRYHQIDNSKVVEKERLIREAGSIDCLVPSGPNIHCMTNESQGEVISIHIYGYDHHLHPSSVRHEYTVVSG